MKPNRKPDWKKGDLLALTQELAPQREHVRNGCFVFEAERDPHQDAFGEWKYGNRNCGELRRATREDVERLIDLMVGEMLNNNGMLAKLREFRDRHFDQRNSP